MTAISQQFFFLAQIWLLSVVTTPVQKVKKRHREASAALPSGTHSSGAQTHTQLEPAPSSLSAICAQLNSEGAFRSHSRSEPLHLTQTSTPLLKNVIKVILCFDLSIYSAHLFKTLTKNCFAKRFCHDRSVCHYCLQLVGAEVYGKSVGHLYKLQVCCLTWLSAPHGLHGK